MPSSLEKSIIATVCYYDVLNYPLTGFEIYKYLINVDFIKRHNDKALKQVQNDRADISFYDIIEALENSLELRKIIFQKNGFYFLKGRDEIIKKHIWRKKIADEKWKKARRIIWFFDCIPFIRMITISGSLALGNTCRESDLDLLIVTKTGRIWTCRTLVTFLTILLGVRRHGNVTRDKICLNHYIVDKSLEIPFKSLYNAQSYARLVPIIDKNGFIFKQFQKANSWIGEYLLFWPEASRRYPGMSPTKNLRAIKSNKVLISLAKFLEIVLNDKIGNFFEKKLAKYERARIEKDPLKEKPGGRIVANDTQLEFHPNSPEVRIIQGFNARMKKLGFLELACQKDSGLVK